MRFLHISDLHIGKRVNGFSMLEDQKYILDQITDIIRKERIQAVLIAGDVYDKAAPSAEAVSLFDEFLTSLAEIDLQVFVISGNHDSAERLSFGNRLMKGSGVFIAPVFDGQLYVHTVTDDNGPVNIYMLPFIRPADVRRFYPDEEICNYTEAVNCIINATDIDTSQRNILISHQFVTGASTCDSETISVGGTDNVDASAYELFDYTALGHIHGPQNIRSDNGLIRYSGTPLKYSLSEKDHIKSVTLIDFPEKGNLIISTVDLKPLHEMRMIRGPYNELTLRDNYKDTATDDYIYAVLTDEEDAPFALSRLRLIYPNIMKLEYDNTRTRTKSELLPADELEQKSELELFADLYRIQNGKDLEGEPYEYVRNTFEEIRGNI